MIGICLAAGLGAALAAGSPSGSTAEKGAEKVTASMPGSTFTLAWMHSIEKIRWEEDYRIINHLFILSEARIRGAGAGMEPPPYAVLKDGVWYYNPGMPAMEKLRLTHSPYTTGYEICRAGKCEALASKLPGIKDTTVIEITPCDLP